MSNKGLVTRSVATISIENLTELIIDYAVDNKKYKGITIDNELVKLNDDIYPYIQTDVLLDAAGITTDEDNSDNDKVFIPLPNSEHNRSFIEKVVKEELKKKYIVYGEDSKWRIDRDGITDFTSPNYKKYMVLMIFSEEDDFFEDV